MATIAQINANRNNAHASTGPRTLEGKSSSARNASTLGLFSANGFVSSNDRDEYHHLSTALLENLQPEGAFEEVFATEIVNATWRLRRCSAVEANLVDPTGESQLDPMQNEANSRIQASVDRARAQAFGLLRRATAELRILQTERLLRETVLPASSDPASLGLARYKDVVTTALSIKLRTPQPANTERSQFTAASTARNSLCPCGSGSKYKRCCGIDAPAVLG